MNESNKDEKILYFFLLVGLILIIYIMSSGCRKFTSSEQFTNNTYEDSKNYLASMHNSDKFMLFVGDEGKDRLITVLHRNKNKIPLNNSDLKYVHYASTYEKMIWEQDKKVTPYDYRVYMTLQETIAKANIDEIIIKVYNDTKYSTNQNISNTRYNTLKTRLSAINMFSGIDLSQEERDKLIYDTMEEAQKINAKLTQLNVEERKELSMTLSPYLINNNYKLFHNITVPLLTRAITKKDKTNYFIFSSSIDTSNVLNSKTLAAMIEKENANMQANTSTTNRLNSTNSSIRINIKRNKNLIAQEKSKIQLMRSNNTANSSANIRRSNIRRSNIAIANAKKNINVLTNKRMRTENALALAMIEKNHIQSRIGQLKKILIH